MKKSILSNQFDVNVLNQLIEDKRSCVILQKLQHHLALHPYHLNDFNKSIKQIMNEDVAKYSLKLNGILFGYKNIKFLSEVAAIFDDSCFIHVDIEADFFIFRPVVGKKLQGIVNKKSNDHVGCLVHQLFNVSLPKLDEDEDWLGHSVTLNSEVMIKITLTDFEGRLPYIRGHIVSILSQPEPEAYTTSRSKIQFDESLNDVDDHEIIEKTPKKKKKKEKKNTHVSEEIESELHKTKKKKSNKMKKIKKEEDEISLPDLNLNELFNAHDLSFGVKSFEMADSEDKKSRKRKHSSSYNEMLQTSLQTKDINISNDSELDNLLQSFNETTMKKKSKKHKTDAEGTPKKKIKLEILD